MLTVTVNPTSNDLTTASTAQRELSLGQDDLTGLAELITQASFLVASHCSRWHATGHEFGEQTVRQTERLTRPLWSIKLERDLNPAITSITEDGTALTAADYELEGERLYRLDAEGDRTCWPATRIVITYTTGFDLVPGLPPDIERACLLVLQQIIATRTRDPMVRSESVDGVVAISYLDPRAGSEGVGPIAADLLKPWKRKDIIP